MSFTMRGPLRDLLTFGKHLRERNRVFSRANSEALPVGAMNSLAGRLHPRAQVLEIASVREEFPGTFTYRLVPVQVGEPSAPPRVAYFRAGQYIAIETSVAGNRVSRPYSIASSPEESLSGNFYDITIKRQSDGYVSTQGLDDWRVGTPLISSEPDGRFYYEPLRDSNNLVCLAGGTGVTPFRSIIPDTLARYPNVRVTLIYGVNAPEEVLYAADFAQLSREYGDRCRWLVVVREGAAGVGEGVPSNRPSARVATGREAPRAQSGASAPDGRGADDTGAPVHTIGLITADLIASFADLSADPTVFICGPEAMQDFLVDQLVGYELPRRRVRRENFGTVDDGSGEIVSVAPPAPGAGARGGKTGVAANDTGPFTIRVRDANGTRDVPARPDETILVALERAGLNPPARCRSGECGWCRSKLVSGTVRSSTKNDGRRGADRKYGYIHPCASYPVTDIVIGVSKNPLGGIHDETGR